jgi:hypothetical protein
MNLRYIALPSGIIIDVEKVAFVLPYPNSLHVCFAATSSTDPMAIKLGMTDARAFLESLVALGVNTNLTIASLTKKQNQD